MDRIVFLIDSFLAGGAEKSILEIASRMKTFEVSVIVLFSDKNDLRQGFVDAGISIYDFSLDRKSLLWFIRGKRELEKLCADIKPSVLHAHLYKSELIARISSLPDSTILIGAFVNDSYSPKRYAEQSFLRNIKLDFIRLLDRLTIRRNFRITSISKTIAVSNGNALKYPSDKIRLIYRGRDVTQGVSPQKKMPFQEKLFTFLVVSRLLVRKGYKELIDAAAKLKEQGADFRILAAGDGVDRTLILDYARKRGTSSSIEFLGYRNDVLELLRQSDCFVFPSHYEGQGGALVEAMLAEKPVIVSDIDVFREQITGGKSGVFFKVGDSDDLATKMKWMMSNYNEAMLMATNAREEAKRRFDITMIVQEYESFYRELIKEYSGIRKY